MKKVLFATTALIATAGVAAADVSFGGDARFGAMYDGTDINQSSRFTLNIDASTEADNGLTFGARVRLRDDAGDVDVTRLSGANYYVKTGGLKVSVGNVPGAIDAQAGLYANSIGLTGLDDHNVAANSTPNGYWGFDGYESTDLDRNGVAVSYSAGDFGVYLGFSDNGGTQRTSVNASYTFSGWTVALGIQDSNAADEDKTVLTIGGNVGVADLNLAVADNQGALKYVLGAGFSVGAATTIDAFVASDASESYGIGVSHSLGGSASIKGGLVQTPAGTTIADMGLNFNF
jgi:outer membrane protein OmpU